MLTVPVCACYSILESLVSLYVCEHLKDNGTHIKPFGFVLMEVNSFYALQPPSASSHIFFKMQCGFVCFIKLLGTPVPVAYHLSASLGVDGRWFLNKPSLGHFCP